MKLIGPHAFIDAADVEGDTATLRGDEARHLAVVLRVRPGEPISIADGAGGVWQGRVAAATQEAVRVTLLARAQIPEAIPRLVVVHALPKGRKLDGVVQRLSEVGVARLVPVHSERSQVHLAGERAAKAVARWRAVALAAAKQSRGARVLAIADVGHWTSALQGVAAGVTLWEEARQPLGEVLDELGGADELVLGIGPEGGLSAEEVAAAGLPTASLGPTILRTETAALVAATVVLHRLGRLG